MSRYVIFYESTNSFVSSARGKVWGSDEVNVEGWKPLKRLPGHESGILNFIYTHIFTLKPTTFF